MIFFNLCLEIWVIRSLVEASSNLYAAVKTTALNIFAASPPRKNSQEFLRKRSDNEATQQLNFLIMLRYSWVHHDATQHAYSCR